MVEHYWEIGHYVNEDDGSVCVNYYRNGELIYHYHDYGGINPRWKRIGKAIVDIEFKIIRDKKRRELCEKIIKEIVPLVTRYYSFNEAS